MPTTLYLVLRVIAAIAIVLAALRWPGFGSSILRSVEERLYLFARRRWLTVATIASLAITANAAIALATRIPQPNVTDEFGHLLAADTFALGRLSNPTHPMWIHFESLQVIQKPTYVSKYPPAQGLILAVGQLLTGQPIAGVWLSAGLACGAICWMLQGWFRPGVALMGALLALYRIGVTSYWSSSYWGGMTAVLGGALVFGALRRVILRPRIGASVVLGLGLAILANSRPYEGLLASIPVFAVLGYRCLRSPVAERALFVRRVAMPICALGFLTLLWMGYYNFRQTGNPLVTAYQVHTAMYQAQPMFAWQPFRTPSRTLPQFSDRSGPERASNLANFEHSIRAAAPNLREHLYDFWSFFCGAVITLPLLAALLTMRSFVWCALASVVAVMSGLILGSMWIFPHYAAPMVGPFFVVITYGWSRLRAYRFQSRPTGRLVARAIVAICMTILAVRIVALSLGVRQETRYGSLVALATFALAAPPVPEWSFQRAAMERQLEQSGGAHLILVRYSPNHSPEQEWIYNKADIDRAPVVWAREMDDTANQKLIGYFRSRSVWLLETDQPSPKLVPYPALASTLQIANHSALVGSHFRDTK